MKFYALFFTIFILTNVVAQSYEIKGYIIDSNGEPISNAHLVELNSNKNCISNQEGRFQILLNQTVFKLQITHIAFNPRVIEGNVNDKLELKILMVEKVNEIGAVDIVHRPYTHLDGRTDKHIYDYELDRNLIYLLTEENKINYLEVWSDDLDNKYKLKLDFKPQTLEKDCFGNTHILTKDYSYQIWLKRDELTLFNPEEIQLYNQYLKPCLASTDSVMVFSSIIDERKEQTIYTMNKASSQIQILMIIDDSAQRISYQDFLERMNGHGGNGIPKMGDISPKMNGSRKKAEQNSWLNTFHLKPTKENPLFIIDSTIVVMNHVYDSAYSFYQVGINLKETQEISYHQVKGFKSEILFDPFLSRLHPIYKNSDFVSIGELDENYALVKSTPLRNHPFPQEIKINRGYAYYLTRKNRDFSPYIELVRVKI